MASVLDRLGAPSRLQALVNTPVGWRDMLVERLRGGRGSAIKGQTRGRGLEDFVEELVKRTIGDGRYDKRCRFVGATGTSSEKTDFAIPSKDDASILIEVKAYSRMALLGATVRAISVNSSTCRTVARLRESTP